MDELLYDNISSYLEKNNQDKLFLLDKDSSELMRNIREREEDLIVGSRQIASKCGVDSKIYDRFLRKGSRTKGDMSATIALKTEESRSNLVPRPVRGDVAISENNVNMLVTFIGDQDYYTVVIDINQWSRDIAYLDNEYQFDRGFSKGSFRVNKNRVTLSKGSIDNNVISNLLTNGVKDFILDKTGYEVDPIVVSDERSILDRNQSYMITLECNLDLDFMFDLNVVEDKIVDPNHFNRIDKNGNILLTARNNGNSYLLYFWDNRYQIYKNCKLIKDVDKVWSIPSYKELITM